MVIRDQFAVKWCLHPGKHTGAQGRAGLGIRGVFFTRNPSKVSFSLPGLHLQAQTADLHFRFHLWRGRGMERSAIRDSLNSGPRLRPSSEFLHLQL